MNDAGRKLWFSSGSPYARIVRIVLAEKGLEYERDRSDQLRPIDTFRAINPNLAVPVLDDAGHRLFDSKVIVEYLLHTYPDHHADPAPTPPLARALTRPEQHWEDLKTLATIETLTESIVNLRLLAGSGIRPETVGYLQRQQERIQVILDWLDRRATPEGFIPGVFSVMDIAFLAAAGFAEARGVAPCRGRPTLDTLLDRLAPRLSVASTLP